MKEFFRLTKFKIIFTLIYVGIFYGLSSIPGLVPDTGLYDHPFYSAATIILWILSWPTLLILHLGTEYRIHFQGCSWFCFPSTGTVIFAFLVGFIYVYLIACVVNLLRARK